MRSSRLPRIRVASTRPSEESILLVIAAFLIVMVVNLCVFLIESRYEHLLNPAVYQVAGRLLGVLLVGFGVAIGIEGFMILGVL